MHDNGNDPKGHELWSDFERFATSQRILLDDGQENWQLWWDCFIAGSSAQFRLDMVGSDQHVHERAARGLAESA
jgi:hypothetical protein